MKFNELVPELSVSDINVSKDFYIEMLGFTLEYERVNEKFAFVSFENSQIMIEQINDHWDTGPLKYPFGNGVNFQISISDIQSFISRLKNKNVILFKELFISNYKINDKTLIQKEILLQDPDGYLLRFSETITKEV